MAERLIQLMVKQERIDDVRACLADVRSDDWWHVPCESERGWHIFFVSLHAADQQDVLDTISDAMDGHEDWRLFSLPTEANLPDLESEEERERLESKRNAASREEIYSDMRQGTALSMDYLLMTALATCVAAMGLTSNQVAVVIGAMVIAPLLGPILAFAFATTLGNFDLLGVALRALGAGLLVATLVGAVIGIVVGGSPDNSMMDFSGALSLRTVVLPLASGAAAALMVAGGQTSALVGVMVAAALLPPLAAFGLLLGGGNYGGAMRAMATVVTNIVAINLAAQVVFLAKGIRPRHWESQQHATSVRVSLGVSLMLVALMAGGLFAAGHGFTFGLY